MIVASCPLRISLVGGSTDHPEYLKKFGKGAVISFPSNLRVYATVHKDVDGLNHQGKYLVNYSEREVVDSQHEIKNDVVRETFRYWGCHKEALTISLTSDVSSIGSGLASSSAYIMAISKALRPDNSNSDIADRSLDIERRMNPYVGAQDFFAATSGGLKKIIFNQYEDEKSFTFNNPNIFDKFTMFLVPSGIRRESKTVLKSIDVDKCQVLMQDVEYLEHAIIEDDVKLFYDTINNSWEHKKRTSPKILDDYNLQGIESDLSSYKIIKAMKLCGAGNGGYFLIFIENDYSYGGNRHKIMEELNRKYNLIKINISNEGLKAVKI